MTSKLPPGVSSIGSWFLLAAAQRTAESGGSSGFEFEVGQTRLAHPFHREPDGLLLRVLGLSDQLLESGDAVHRDAIHGAGFTEVFV